MSFFVIYLVLAEPNSPLSVCCNARRRSIVSAKACRDLPEGEKESQDFVPFCLPSDTSLSLPPSTMSFVVSFSQKVLAQKENNFSFLSFLSHISHFDDFCKTSFANPFELSGRIGQSLSNVEDSCCWTMRHSAITGIAEGGRHETHTRATWGERATTTTTSTWGEREREST